MEWNKIKNLEAKKQMAELVITNLSQGDTVGVGSGSSALVALLALAARVQEKGITGVSVVPASLEIRWAAEEAGLQVSPPKPLSWLFDGADEVDAEGNLIKGSGGAFLREKLLFSLTKKRFVLADKSKLVQTLGERFPIPLEVLPDAYLSIIPDLYNLGAEEMKLREANGKNGPVITENGNIIIDAKFKEITPGLEGELSTLPGLLASGLFQGYDLEIISEPQL